MVFLKVCLIYKGWKVYCHLESKAWQRWSVWRQLCTAALALCLLHVFKLPCLNLRPPKRPGLQKGGSSCLPHDWPLSPALLLKLTFQKCSWVIWSHTADCSMPSCHRPAPVKHQQALTCAKLLSL